VVVIITKENRLMIIASIYNVIWYINYCLSCVSAHAGSISNLNLDFNHNVNPSPIMPIIFLGFISDFVRQRRIRYNNNTVLIGIAVYVAGF
jgi:hypothetical protein